MPRHLLSSHSIMILLWVVALLLILTSPLPAQAATEVAHRVVGTEAGMVMLRGDRRGTRNKFGDLSTSFESEQRLFAALQIGVTF